MLGFLQKICFPPIRIRSIIYLFLIKDNLSEKISKNGTLPIGILQVSFHFNVKNTYKILPLSHTNERGKRLNPSLSKSVAS